MIRLVTIPAALLLLLTSHASALVIRHDTPTIDYENHGRDPKFNASTGIVRGNDTDYGIAGATAIDSRWGVHARHTLRRVETWMNDGNTAKLRGTKWNAWNFQGLANVNVAEVIHFFDDFTRFANAIDIALIRTNAPSSTLRIAPLFAGWDEVGRVGSSASAANNRQDGNGNSRKPEHESTSNSGRPYEARWSGKNDINQVNGQGLGSPANALLRIDMDHPTNTSHSVMGGNRAIDLEYGTMNGDSGSPIYIDKNGLEGQVAGVVSGGSGNRYGDTGVYVRIRPYRNWIFDTILANPDNRTISLPPIGDQIAAVGEPFSVTVSASGSDQGPLSASFKLIDPPAGATIDPDSGRIEWTPGAQFTGTTRTFTVEATENGVVANSATTTFHVTVSGEDEIPFWSWSAAPPNWSTVTVGDGGSPYGQASSSFPYLQGDANTLLYQPATGTLPRWATVTVQIKLADFHQTWSKGAPVEFGFFDGQPEVANAATPFLHSSIAEVPNYDSGEGLADGLGNTAGNVDYAFSFGITEPLVSPWFAVRKNIDGHRIGIDDIVISYHIADTDDDGIPDLQEQANGTDPALADTDSDGLDDGVDPDPLDPDSDADGYADGYDSDPNDPDLPGGPNPESIGINFASARGFNPGVVLPANAYAGAPEVAQKNWNQTSPFDGQSISQADTASPSPGTLVDSLGNPTTLNYSATMSNTWSATNESLTPYGPLFSAYLDANNATDCVLNLSGIPYASYDVYVYVGSDVNGRTGTISDGSTTYSLTTSSESTTTGRYVRTRDTRNGNPEANYARFEARTSPTLTLTYDRGSGNGGIFAVQIVSNHVPTPYETWASSHGLDHETDGLPHNDPDGDTIDNGVEFALGTDPSDSSSHPALTPSSDSTSFTLTFIQSKDAGTATITPEWSVDLKTWHTDGITVQQLADDADTRTLSASLAKDGRESVHLRLVVSLP